MNDPRPYFNFHIADFWGADEVESMTFEAVGLYLAMLSREWQQGSLTSDAAALRRLFGGRCVAWDQSFAAVRACFFEEGGKLFNVRLEEERAKADVYSAKQSGAAKARWGAWKASRNAAALPPLSHGTAAAMPEVEWSGMEQHPPAAAAPSKRFTPTWPKHLDTPAVHAAWAEWEVYRIGRKDKPVGPVSFKRIVNRYQTAAALVAAIGVSIESNWQGIHPDKNFRERTQPTGTTIEAFQ